MSAIAFIFPGQGSQSVGMGRALAEKYPVARHTLTEANEVLGYDLMELCFEGPAETLTATQHAQPAILAVSVAAWRVLLSERPELAPSLVAGHSLGEYSALVAAGALSYGDALRLTQRRGELMAAAGEARPGSMCAILKLPDSDVEAICHNAALISKSAVQVANFNSPGQVVISGETAGVAKAGELARGAGGRVMPLAVSIAAHSILMTQAVAPFREVLAGISFTTPLIMIIGNVQAAPLTDSEGLREELTRQLTSPVRWTETVRQFVGLGIGRIIEVGPGNALSGLVRRIDAALTVTSFGTPADLEAL
jgi:[acyl-carrier-protein] S-malonyltransferase